MLAGKVNNSSGGPMVSRKVGNSGFFEEARQVAFLTAFLLAGKPAMPEFFTYIYKIHE